MIVTKLTFELPSPLSRAVAFATGTGVLVCGGLLASGSTTRAMVNVDLPTGTATTIGSLAIGVHDAAGAAVGGQNLVLGGGNATPLSTIQTCDPTGSSAIVGQLPSARADLSAATATRSDGTTEAVVVGGAGATLQPAVLATPDGRHVMDIGQLAEGVRYAAVVAIGSSIVVIGGFRDGADIRDIQVLDLVSGRTRIVSHLPAALAHAAAFVLDGQIVVAGGIRSGQRQTAIWAIDPATWADRRLGDLPVALSDAAPVLVDGMAYLVGGETPSGTVATILELKPD